MPAAGGPRRRAIRSQTGEPPAIDERGYLRLASLRAGIREYLAWAELRAREQGLTPAQVQLALVVRAHPDSSGPTLTQLAQALLLRHHSVVGLVDRAEQAGLVMRTRDDRHLSRVHVQLTPAGADQLAILSAQHLRWLVDHGDELGELWMWFAADARG